MHSGYVYTDSGELYLRNLADGSQYLFIDGSWLQSDEGKFQKFRNGSYYFSDQDEVVKACLVTKPFDCVTSVIAKDSFVYLYASFADTTLVISNHGQAQIFREGQWENLYRHGEIYNTDSRNYDDVDHNPTQFYSSIQFQGKTLIGEWPTGRLYEFDGERLFPSDLSNTAFTDLSSQRLGYEAQSMAEYCGDLFVGYWPKGEIYRLDGQTKVWELEARLFSSTAGEEFIPFHNRKNDSLNPAFFGQRITALVPWKDSLYVSTSNLREWTKDIVTEVIPPQLQDEYGKIYKIHKDGCFTTYR